MREIWLHNNRRMTGLAWAGSIVFLVVGLAAVYWTSRSDSVVVVIAAVLTSVMAGWMAFRQAKQFFTPRLTYTDGFLRVILGAQPISIPIDTVEVFFLGQGDSHLQTRLGGELVNSTVVVRLAESATDWLHRQVDERFGHWCDGYITIRGAWCEPLNVDVIRRLNHRLVEVKRELRKTHASSGESKHS